MKCVCNQNQLENHFHGGNINPLVCSLYKTVMGALVDLIVNLVVIVEAVNDVVLTGTEIVVFALAFLKPTGFSVVSVICGTLV